MFQDHEQSLRRLDGKTAWSYLVGATEEIFVMVCLNTISAQDGSLRSSTQKTMRRSDLAHADRTSV